jgi:hypothetical protein
MINPDLGPQEQLLLLSMLCVMWFALFSRVIVFIRLESAGVTPLYPQSWSENQRRTLERLRSSVGLALIWLWAIFAVMRPTLPTNWPFGYLEAMSLIALMTASYAWVLLLAPRNLRRLDSVPGSFAIFIAFLVVWWGTAFALIGWMLAKATAEPLSLIPANLA